MLGARPVWPKVSSNTSSHIRAHLARKGTSLIFFSMAAAIAGDVGCRRVSPESGSLTTPSMARVAAGAGASAIKAAGEAQIGDRTACAMHSDAVFTVTASTPKVEYRGRTYYFCCPECAKSFAERPDDFVK